MDADQPPFSFLSQQLPPSFERRVIFLAPGHTRVYDVTDWRSALVVVEHGQVELEWLDGRRRPFGRGDVLWLDGLSLRALHNHRSEAAVLAAVSRRAAKMED